MMSIQTSNMQPSYSNNASTNIASVESMNIDTLTNFLNELGIKIAKSSIHKKTSTGEIPYKKIFGSLVFYKDEILEWINANAKSKNELKNTVGINLANCVKNRERTSIHS